MVKIRCGLLECLVEIISIIEIYLIVEIIIFSITSFIKEYSIAIKISIVLGFFFFSIIVVCGISLLFYGKRKLIFKSNNFIYKEINCNIYNISKIIYHKYKWYNFFLPFTRDETIGRLEIYMYKNMKFVEFIFYRDLKKLLKIKGLKIEIIDYNAKQ